MTSGAGAAPWSNGRLLAPFFTAVPLRIQGTPATPRSPPFLRPAEPDDRSGLPQPEYTAALDKATAHAPSGGILRRMGSPPTGYEMFMADGPASRAWKVVDLINEPWNDFRQFENVYAHDATGPAGRLSLRHAPGL